MQTTLHSLFLTWDDLNECRLDENALYWNTKFKGIDKIAKRRHSLTTKWCNFRAIKLLDWNFCKLFQNSFATKSMMIINVYDITIYNNNNTNILNLTITVLESVAQAWKIDEEKYLSSKFVFHYLLSHQQLHKILIKSMSIDNINPCPSLLNRMS